MRFVVYLLSGIFMVAGVGVMIGGITQIRLAQASATWPTTVGTIIVSEIKTSTNDDGTTYRPLVKFSYQVNGEKWTGDEVFFGGGKISSSNYKYASKVVNKYPVKSRVTVFYNPSKPNIAVIEAGVTKKTFILFTFGSLFFIVGLWFGILFWLFE